MAKEQPTTVNEPNQEAPAVRVALDEFCALLSGSEKRYTLIAAFHSSERAQGALLDTADSYKSRFDKFIKKSA